jgi:indole-3-glycerol phosphate synthase
LEIAIGYESAGAACISVLTDRVFFKGGIDDLMNVRKRCGIPVLRKDFVIDPYQVFQSRAYGADCILLIAAALELNQMVELEEVASSLGMSVLVEVHNEAELELALSCNSNLIGVNNRDLNTFTVSIENSLKLSSMLPKNKLAISESGISSHEDMQLLMDAGISCFLIGESLMKHEDPGMALEFLLQKF